MDRIEERSSFNDFPSHFRDQFIFAYSIFCARAIARYKGICSVLKAFSYGEVIIVF